MGPMRKKKPGVTEPRPPPAKPARVRVPVAVLLRMFVLGGVAIVATIWAIWRHYTVPRMPMLEPVPSASEHEVDLDRQ